MEYPSSKVMKISDDTNAQPKAINDQYSNDFNREENDGREGWICGRGMAIKRNNDQIQCFCPPSLYGEYCQYYSDRITIIISLENIPLELVEQENNIIKIFAVLFSNEDIVDEHVLHFPLILSKELDKKFRFNLVYPRPKVFTNSYRVRFEAYNLGLHSSIELLAVWEYPIHFPFLSSYRIAQVLKFNKNATFISVEHVCRRANPCLQNNTCNAILNQINDLSAYYCHCNNQTFGKHCEQSFQL